MAEAPDIARPAGWSSRGWAARLEYLAGQVTVDAGRFGPDDKERKLKLAARLQAAAEKERAGDEPGSNPGTDE